MTARSESVDIQVDGDTLAGTLLMPGSSMPGILFVHGWGGSQQRDLARARGIAGLGCVCLTFDLRGHENTFAQREQVTRAHNLADLVAAYDRLANHAATDNSAIAVIGSSYGSYLATILSQLRPVRWLALRVPALYWDEEWDTPKHALDRERLQTYRRVLQNPANNRALKACTEFKGDVLIIESEHDEYVPHITAVSYRDAFINAHSLTHRVIDGADHALSGEGDQAAYTSLLTTWVSEMVVGARVGAYPHH